MSLLEQHLKDLSDPNAPKTAPEPPPPQAEASDADLSPERKLSRALIKRFTKNTPPRPRAFSCWSPIPAPEWPTRPDFDADDYLTDYTSWPALIDKHFSGRHLPPADKDYIARIQQSAPLGEDPWPYPKPGQISPLLELFRRPGPIKKSRSSLLFAFFAQWFTDSVLRTNRRDRRRNTSNHDIDLCQIYGLTEAQTHLLRSPQGGGRLRSQTLPNGEEVGEYLFYQQADGTYEIKPEFRGLLPSQWASEELRTELLEQFPDPDYKRTAKLYATGLERGNSSIGYSAISTIFLREHNRIADELKKNNPSWTDERLFQTARNINIVLLLKLVVEDYINHILGERVLLLDHEFAEQESWYRPNWMALEFDLLYRWHGLPPDTIEIPGGTLAHSEFRHNNALLEELGVGAVIEAASRQAAGAIHLRNTPVYLLAAEYQALQMGRDLRVQPYNEYRKLFGLKAVESFDELTDDPWLRTELSKLYPSVDDIEFLVGVFAEKPLDPASGKPEKLFGGLLTDMVAYDAFTQIFTNPLLSKNVYGPQTFTDYGVQLIEETKTVEDLVNRNVSRRVRASLGVIVD